MIVTPKKNHGWYFLMFAINWIYWNLELLQHVNMKHNNKFYWYIKSFQSFDYLLASLCIIFQPNHFPQQNNWSGDGKFVACTPCLKWHVHKKLTGSRRVSCLYHEFAYCSCWRAKELRILEGSDFFQTWKLSLWKPHLCLLTHSYSDKLVLRRIQYFII